MAAPSIAYHDVSYAIRIAESSGIWSSPYSSTTVATGDYIVVTVVGDDNMSMDVALDVAQTAGTAKITGFIQAPLARLNNYCFNGAWTTKVTTGGTFTCAVFWDVVASINDLYGSSMYVATGSGGIGAVAMVQNANSMSFATTGANSAVVCSVTDWDAKASLGATFEPTGATVHRITTDGQTSQATNGTYYSAYAAHWGNTGSIATQSYGLANMTGGKYNVVLVEILASGIIAPSPQNLINNMLVAALSACAAISQEIAIAQATLTSGSQPDLTALTAAVANLATTATAGSPNL